MYAAINSKGENNRIIKVVWNKQGFKYFGGYEYSVNGFMNYLRKLHKAEVII